MSVSDQSPLGKLCDLVLGEFVTSESQTAELAVSPEGGALRFRRGEEWAPVMAFPAPIYSALLARLRLIAGGELAPGNETVARVLVNGVTHEVRFAAPPAGGGAGLLLTRLDSGA